MKISTLPSLRPTPAKPARSSAPSGEPTDSYEPTPVSPLSRATWACVAGGAALGAVSWTSLIGASLASHSSVTGGMIGAIAGLVVAEGIQLYRNLR